MEQVTRRGLSARKEAWSSPYFLRPPTLKFSMTTSLSARARARSRAPRRSRSRSRPSAFPDCSVVVGRAPGLSRGGRDIRRPRSACRPRAGPLHLDHLGAEIGEQLPAPGPREDAGEFEDADTGEGFHRWRHVLLTQFGVILSLPSGEGRRCAASAGRGRASASAFVRGLRTTTGRYGSAVIWFFASRDWSNAGQSPRTGHCPGFSRVPSPVRRDGQEERRRSSPVSVRFRCSRT